MEQENSSSVEAGMGFSAELFVTVKRASLLKKLYLKFKEKHKRNENDSTPSV